MKLHNYWMSKANKDGQWFKEQALTFLYGTLVSLTKKPNHQLIV